MLVVGAGSAGCCAAIAAAEHGRRDGLRVGLVERYGFAGGVSTQTLDTFYGFYTPGDEPRKVVGGVPDRVVDALASNRRHVSAQQHLRCGHRRHLQSRAAQAGVGSIARRRRASASGSTRCSSTSTTDAAGTATGVVVFTKSGFHRIDARRIIDASGDADVCHWLGLDYELAGELDPAQTLTTTFRMCNVDLERFQAAGGKADARRTDGSGDRRAAGIRCRARAAAPTRWCNPVASPRSPCAWPTSTRPTSTS